MVLRGSPVQSVKVRSHGRGSHSGETALQGGFVGSGGGGAGAHLVPPSSRISKLTLFSLATVGIAFTGLAATTEVANAVVYCNISDIPVGASRGPVFVSWLGPARLVPLQRTRPGIRNGGVNKVGVRR